MIHFVGIGGIGMSALARYFLSQNEKVSGSDLYRSPITDALQKEGAVINIGKHTANTINKLIKLVIYTQAVSQNNPEIVKAKKLGIPVQSYPEAIGELTKKYKTVAIAGSHGKSTTTAMTALILKEGGFDPTVIIGTNVPQFTGFKSLKKTAATNKFSNNQFGTNFRKGNSNWLVLEADEYKESFLHYSPTLAAITNIDAEHLDYYKNFSNVKKAFEKFKKRADKVVQRCHRANTKCNEYYAIKKVLRVPGEHNIQNALLAYAIGRELKIPRDVILKGLAKYRGSWRRMQRRGLLKINSKKVKGIVFDDYAHHPTEIKSTLSAFKEKWSKNRLICVFQPHQIQRLKILYNDFKTAFNIADKIIILPPYEVAGRELETMTTKKSAIKNNLARKLAQEIGAVYEPAPQKNLKNTLINIISNCQPSKRAFIIVMMGAGTINQFTSKLINE